jgi:hypothetical protein
MLKNYCTKIFVFSVIRTVKQKSLHENVHSTLFWISTLKFLKTISLIPLSCEVTRK